MIGSNDGQTLAALLDLPLSSIGSPGEAYGIEGRVSARNSRCILTMTTEDGTQWSRALDVLLLLSHSDRPAPSLLGRDIIYDLPMVIHLREKRVELNDDIAT